MVVQHLNHAFEADFQPLGRSEPDMGSVDPIDPGASDEVAEEQVVFDGSSLCHVD